MTLSERDMLIAKISLIKGVVAVGRTTPEKATDRLKIIAKQHGATFEEALILESELDQMFGDDTLR